jgi:hypothetical protein
MKGSRMNSKDWLLFMMLLAPCAGALLAETRPAQPRGLPLTTTISFGDEYMTPVELYDAKITVLEVVRGEKARKILEDGNPLNNPSGNFEYVAARIRFAFLARGVPGDKRYRLDVEQFTACSSDGAVEYPAVHRPFPNPSLDRELGSGDSAEGWVGFLVALEDARPLLVFKEDVRILTRSGIGVRFQLY